MMLTPFVSPYFASGAWSPSDLATLKSWYDADATYMSLSGTLVTAWNDISGNGYHVSAPSGVEPDFNAAGSYVYFGAGEYLTIASRMGLSSNPDLIMIGVVDPVSTGGGVKRLAQVGDGGFTRPIAAAQGASTWSFRYNDGNETYGSVSTGQQIAAHVRPSGGNYAAGQFFLNGTERTRTGGAGDTNAPSNTAERFYLGSGIAAVIESSETRFNEYIIAETSSTDDRQKLEGYLAHRWGLESSLPSGHPYKSSPP